MAALDTIKASANFVCVIRCAVTFCPDSAVARRLGLMNRFIASAAPTQNTPPST